MCNFVSLSSAGIWSVPSVILQFQNHTCLHIKRVKIVEGRSSTSFCVAHYATTQCRQVTLDGEITFSRPLVVTKTPAHYYLIQVELIFAFSLSLSPSLCVYLCVSLVSLQATFSAHETQATTTPLFPPKLCLQDLNG